MKPRSILLFVAALLVVAGILTSHWSSFSFHSSYDGAEDMSAHNGLVLFTMCTGSECHTNFMLGNLGHMASSYAIASLVGLLIFACGLGLAILCVLTGVAAHRGRRGPATIVLILAGVVLFFAIVFKLLGGFQPATWGYSMLLFFPGVALAFYGALLAQSGIATVGAPRMMMTPYGYAMPTQPPPCNQCGCPTMFIPQYGKLFCSRCNRYLV